MQAARLNRPGEALEVIETDEPEVIPGGIKVRVIQANVPSFTAHVMAGQTSFPLPVPYFALQPHSR